MATRETLAAMREAVQTVRRQAIAAATFVLGMTLAMTGLGMWISHATGVLLPIDFTNLAISGAMLGAGIVLLTLTWRLIRER